MLFASRLLPLDGRCSARCDGSGIGVIDALEGRSTEEKGLPVCRVRVGGSCYRVAKFVGKKNIDINLLKIDAFQRIGDLHGRPEGLPFEGYLLFDLDYHDRTESFIRRP